MIDLPDAPLFTSLFHDPHFYMAVGTAGLAGLVRGFSGFGSALIYIPLMSAVYDPRVAAVTFAITDIITGLSFLSGVWRKANWREVVPMAVSAVFAAQFGTLVLQYASPIALRWGLCVLVTATVAVLASGWRYHGSPKLPVTIAVGLLAGLLGGAVQISGPPIIVYWLGSGAMPDVLRANFFAYFSIFSMASIVTYAVHGLITALTLALVVFTTPCNIAGMWLGSKLFVFASEKTYRRVAYLVVAMSVLISLPLWDSAR